MTQDIIQVGQSACITRTITEQDIETFAKLSLDRNPIHFDEAFAAGTLFGRRIAHGMLGMALISGALTALMGAGNIWISSSVKFEKPIFIDDTLTCTLTVTEVARRGVADINVLIENDRSETIISGSVKSMRFVARACQ